MNGISRFHTAAFGILICKHENTKVFLKLIAKEYSIVSMEHTEGSLYLDKHHNTTIHTECDNIYKISLYDDIKCELGSRFEINGWDLQDIKFTYIHNPKIKIGYPHICALMVYLGCAGDDLGGEKEPIIVNDETMTDLLAWKNILINEDRIPNESKLQMICNCCS